MNAEGSSASTRSFDMTQTTLPITLKYTRGNFDFLCKKTHQIVTDFSLAHISSKIYKYHGTQPPDAKVEHGEIEKNGY